MTRKLLGIVLISAGLSSLSTAGFADAPKPTVSELLASCPVSDEPNYTNECKRPIAMELLATAVAVSMKGKAAIGICLPTKVAGQQQATVAIIKWLRENPDMQPKSQDDGLFAAMKALYPCT